MLDINFSSQEVGDPLASGGDWNSDLSEFTGEEVRDDSVEHRTLASALRVVTMLQRELHLHVDCIVH